MTKREKELWENWYEGTYTLAQTDKKFGLKISTCGLTKYDAEVRGKQDLETRSYVVRKTTKEDFYACINKDKPMTKEEAKKNEKRIGDFFKKETLKLLNK